MKDLYDAARYLALTGGMGLLTNTIKPVLVDTSLYTFNKASHTSLADIPAGARVAIGPALSGKTVSSTGIFDAADTVVPSVASGRTAHAVALIVDTGVEATSTLIYYTDESVEGLPCSTNGGNVLLKWPNTADKIFAI